MKKFKKDYILGLRVNGLMVDRIDDLAEFMSMDRADWLRMVIWNGIKYYQKIKEDKSNIATYKDLLTKDPLGYTNQAAEQELTMEEIIRLKNLVK